MKIDLPENVIKIDDWKKTQMLSSKEQGLTDYLNVLSFHDLMNESSDIINEIHNNDEISQDLQMKSKLLADELGDRIDHHSGGISDTFHSLKKNIEETLNKLNTLL